VARFPRRYFPGSAESAKPRPFHPAAARWVAQTANRPQPVSLCRVQATSARQGNSAHRFPPRVPEKLGGRNRAGSELPGSATSAASRRPPAGPTPSVPLVQAHQAGRAPGQASNPGPPAKKFLGPRRGLKPADRRPGARSASPLQARKSGAGPRPATSWPGWQARNRKLRAGARKHQQAPAAASNLVRAPVSCRFIDHQPDRIRASGCQGPVSKAALPTIRPSRPRFLGVGCQGPARAPNPGVGPGRKRIEGNREPRKPPRIAARSRPRAATHPGVLGSGPFWLIHGPASSNRPCRCPGGRADNQR